MKKIAIYGASGHGKVVADIARLNGYHVVCFVDDDRSKKEFCGLNVVSFDEVKDEAIAFAIGIGINKIREIIYNKLSACNLNMPVLIHPSAVVASDVNIAEATVVMACVVINSSANIGVGAILNSSSVVEHDCVVGDFAHLSPRVALAGGVTIGRRVHMGIGSCVIQSIVVGDDCVVGAGGVVIKDISEKSLAVGVPARVVRAED